MKKLSLALLAVSALFFTSCATIATPAGLGTIYTDMQSGETATSNTSINAAAKKAGIKKISHVDSKKSSILGLYGKYTIFVYGE